MWIVNRNDSWNNIWNILLRPTVLLKANNTITQECRMCGKHILNKKQYSYVSPYTEVKLTVCRDCGVREYYGTRGKSTKTYKRHMRDKLLFGVEENV